MEFELRKFKSDDMFTMFTILSKIGFKDIEKIMTPEKIKEISNAMRSVNGENNNEIRDVIGMTICMEIVAIIIKNLPSCKNEIYTLLSDLSGLSVKEISELSMTTFTKMIVAVIKKEEFVDFIKVVAEFFN